MPPGVGNAEPVVPLYTELVPANALVGARPQQGSFPKRPPEVLSVFCRCEPRLIGAWQALGLNLKSSFLSSEQIQISRFEALNRHSGKIGLAGQRLLRRYAPRNDGVTVLGIHDLPHNLS